MRRLPSACKMHLPAAPGDHPYQASPDAAGRQISSRRWYLFAPRRSRSSRGDFASDTVLSIELR